MLGFQAYPVEIEQHLFSSSIVLPFTNRFTKLFDHLKKKYRYKNQLGRKKQKKSFLNHV
jgi:hypothetical protein